MPPSPPNIALLFGGRSEEHAVSLSSAHTLISAFRQLSYQLWPVAVSTSGDWFLVDAQRAFSSQEGRLRLNQSALHTAVAIVPQRTRAQLITLANATVLCPQIDAIFPIIHGRDGEDGALQGLAQLCNIPCCGSSLNGAALSMDKLLTKKVLQHHGIPVTPFRSLHRGQALPDWSRCQAELGGSDIFVKPSSQGSSVGVSRVTCEDEWLPALRNAWRYDHTVLVEQGLHGREIEFAILQQQGELKVSSPGEIVVDDGSFYDYQHKYNDNPHVRLTFDASLPTRTKQAMQHTAKEAFRALELSGFARVDFFLLPDGHFVVNELNSLPGFTQTSMFPILWQQHGIPLASVVASIVEHALSS